ncbi:Plasmodium exported protein, unknown function [Plasmodium gallinaceum]|uniref:Transmembrane protein n=1 Tax=Plasmodium gallinaceum TaxID=5849 RepID=A0A1J1GXX2_PLAGA|nr:Plasmodium exported protein, unknown function [Plasmodium gallinaceum]CRG97150.1 Plasmodium exported protein, unknown function [Plasmodium gallinaceum]
MDSITSKLQNNLQQFKDSTSSSSNCVISILESLLPVKPQNIEEVLFIIMFAIFFYIWISVFCNGNNIEYSRRLAYSNVQVITENKTKEAFLRSKRKRRNKIMEGVREREERRREIRRFIEKLKEQQEENIRIRERIKRREGQIAKRKKKLEKMKSSTGETENEYKEIEENE